MNLRLSTTVTTLRTMLDLHVPEGRSAPERAVKLTRRIVSLLLPATKTVCVVGTPM